MDYMRLFEDYRVPYTTRVNRGWVNTHCPFCDDGKGSYNLGFNPVEDYCNCWRCGGHSLYETLGAILHVQPRDIKSILQSYRGVGRGEAPRGRKGGFQGELKLPTDGFTASERRYLEKRGFDADFLHEKYGIVGGGFDRRWHDRIVIPLVYGGRIVSWVGRSILSKRKLKEYDIPRYRNLSVEESVVNPKEVFFNLDNCKGREVILTEGIFDVLRLASVRNADGDNVICSLGTQLTQAQIALLAERFDKVYILFDNEPEAQEKARRYGMQLASMGMEVEVVDAYSEYGVNDGGDCNQEQVEEIRSELGFA